MSADLDYKGIAEQARHDAAREAAPLEPGAYVAWSICQLGHTSGFSRVHRVGESIGGDEMTTCGEIVASPVMRVVLTPGLVRAFGRCTHCEAIHARRLAVVA